MILRIMPIIRCEFSRRPTAAMSRAFEIAVDHQIDGTVVHQPPLLNPEPARAQLSQ